MVPAGDLRPWLTTERLKLFVGGRPRSPGAPLYAHEEREKAYRVCDICAGKLEAGASVGALQSGRIGRQMVLFALLLVLIAFLTPVLLPYVRRALWLN